MAQLCESSGWIGLFTWVSVYPFLYILIGMLLGYSLPRFRFFKPRALAAVVRERVQNVSAQRSQKQKMVLIVRQDLKMGKGKIAAQCAHAAVGCYKKAVTGSETTQEWVRQWETTGQMKIALRGDNENMMYSQYDISQYIQQKLIALAYRLDLEKKAKARGLPTKFIRDSGRTQIPAGSHTVLGILGPEKVVTELTGDFKLL